MKLSELNIQGETLFWTSSRYDAATRNHVALSLADVSSLYYGDFSRSEFGDAIPVLLPEFLGYSDYSGCSVERANFRAFTEQFKAGEGEWWFKAWGGHGTEAIALIPGAELDDETAEELRETFAGLENYPCLDDEALSEIEMEAENEAWESWARHDFTRGLVKLFPDHEEAIDNASDETIREIFETARETANEYWEIETGGGAWIRIEKIAAKVSPDSLAVLS